MHSDERVLDDLFGRLDVAHEQHRESHEPAIVGGVQLIHGGVGIPRGGDLHRTPKVESCCHFGAHVSCTHERSVRFTRRRIWQVCGVCWRAWTHRGNLTVCSARSCTVRSPRMSYTRPVPVSYTHLTLPTI